MASAARKAAEAAMLPFRDGPHLTTKVTAEAVWNLAVAMDALLAEPDGAGATPKTCNDPCPPTFSGHWRDWHKGHGCDVEARVLASLPAPPPAPETAAVREAAGSRYATCPDRGDNRVPYCSEQCPQHDGKRCRIMGVRPSSICEPEVLNLLAALSSPPASPAALDGDGRDGHNGDGPFEG